jgi:hypothetical protein
MAGDSAGKRTAKARERRDSDCEAKRAALAAEREATTEHVWGCQLGMPEMEGKGITHLQLLVELLEAQALQRPGEAFLLASGGSVGKVQHDGEGEPAGHRPQGPSQCHRVVL